MQGFKLVVLAAFLVVSSLFASEVKLKNGKVYSDVTILGRDDQGVEIAVPHGKIKLPLDKVESIDGVTIPQTEPAANSLPGPMALVYVHRWSMDVFLLVMGLMAMGWIGVLIWVQHDVKGMPEEIKRTNADVLLLPVLGFVMYLVERQRRLREGLGLSGDSSAVIGWRDSLTGLEYLRRARDVLERRPSGACSAARRPGWRSFSA